MRTRLFLLLLTTIFTLSLQAQVLSGKVTNTYNEPVVGASVKVVGESFGTTTNVEGRYVIRLVVEESFIIEVSAVGYGTKRVSDVSRTNNAEELNIVLENVATVNEEVVVTTTSRRQESTASLLTFQKNNTAVSSGIAADFIRRTPDKNTGEVLKRVSGASVQDNKYVIVRGLSDRYNQALLNNALMPSSEPDKKTFSFDIIPSGMIDNIIINKTATSDLPGDFAGGVIQINTKDIPTRDYISVGFSIGYNTQSTFKDFTSNRRNSLDWLGFDDGSRKLASDIPATTKFRSMSDDGKIEATKKYFKDDVYSEETRMAIPTSSLNLTWGNVARLKNNASFGTILSLFHRQSQTIYDHVERGRYEMARDYTFMGTEKQNRYNVNSGGLANLTYAFRKHKISFKNIFNQLFEDNYFVRNVDNPSSLQEVSTRSSVLNQRFLYSGQLEGDHALSSSGLKFQWNGNFAYNHKEQPDMRTATYTRRSNTNGAFGLNDDDTRRFFSDLKDYTFGGNAFVLAPFTLGDRRHNFKIGGGHIGRIRYFDARMFRYERGSVNSDYTLPYDRMFLNSNINEDGVFLDEITQNTDSYIGVSNLSNGYAMLDNRLSDKIRVIWGLRAEYFQQYLSTTNLSGQKQRVRTNTLDYLPSLNFTYSFNPRNQLRAAASRTVARPEFREIAPFQFFDYEQMWGLGGNPDLKRTSILNFDLRYEFYPKSGENISFAVLAKNLNDPIELRMDPGSNSDRWVFVYANADKAFMYGAELDIRKSLDFISGYLSKLVFTGNFTYLDSKVTLTTQQASGNIVNLDRPLYGQSPYLINAGFEYSNNDWNATLLYNRIGPRVNIVGDPVVAGFFDLYEKPRNLLDIQVAKKIFEKRGELKLTVSDLFNNRFVFYDNPTSKPRYDYAGGDRINYSYSPGTNISLGFSYDFDLRKK